MIVNFADWYWIVGNDETRVYSSAAGDFVPADNETYLAWVSQGGVPTRIASEIELGEVLAAYSLRPSAPDVLDGYKESQADQLTIEIAAKLLFNQENRLRVLEGREPFNADQFREWIKEMV